MMKMPRYRLIWVRICLLAAGVGFLVPGPNNAWSKADARQPAALLYAQNNYCLHVEKATQKLSLYDCSSQPFRLVKTYECSTGKKHGDKTESGDRKTPEGAYFFKKIYCDDQLEPRYGVLAYVLDFPNHIDRRERKGGNGIWLHGLDRPLLPYDSQGCIALRNEDILELSDRIELNRTPIIIEETAHYLSNADAQAAAGPVLLFIERWRDAWTGKNLDSYAGCYSSKKFKKGEIAAWKNHKETLNRKYKFIDVALNDLTVLEHDGTYIVGFQQNYESDTFTSVGFKKLYLQKNSEQLAIVEEEWAPAYGADPNDLSADALQMRTITRVLNRWVNAWEDKQLQRYMETYSKEFTSQGMDWNGWKQHKDRINSNNDVIRVTIIKPFVHIDGPLAHVTYTQQYVSDAYTDYGLKKLTLQQEQGTWKIVSESWEPI